MKNIRFFHLAIAAAAGLLVFSLACGEEKVRMPLGNPTAAPVGEGWVNLFDAAHAGQWQNTSGKVAGFDIEDGVFHIPGTKVGGYLMYAGETFSDFEMHIEYKVAPKANSGVFFRSDPKNPVQGGFEIQVFDDCGKPASDVSSGSLYDVATPMFNMSKPAGEWNSFDIMCKGPLLIVVMNGWKIVDTDLSQMTMPIGKFDTPLAQLPQDGHFLLQDHHGEVWYRNMLVKKL